MGHILITGPGRTGTTFLVQLLTRLGCDTGFEPYREPFDENIRAGGEIDNVDIPLESTVGEAKAYMKTLPRIFKAPDWSWKLKLFLARGYVNIEHVILPFRDLDEAAQSRLAVGLDWMVSDTVASDEKAGVQAAVCAAMFGRAIEVCYLYQIPLHIMRFPEFVRSADYCYQRLNRIFDFDYGTFKDKHKELAWR